MDTAGQPPIGESNRNRRGQWGKNKGKICSAEGCDVPARCRGMCDPHYRKWKWASGYRAPSERKSKRDHHLKHRYGVTPEEYNCLLERQDGCCAVCRTPAEDCPKPQHWIATLCVDHCHATGTTRGLLCNSCNLMFKRGQSSAELYDAAGEYIRFHNGTGNVDPALRREEVFDLTVNRTHNFIAAGLVTHNTCWSR
jgi:hypothetical protein